jgi:hypothetical protein
MCGASGLDPGDAPVRKAGVTIIWFNEAREIEVIICRRERSL